MWNNNEDSFHDKFGKAREEAESTHIIFTFIFIIIGLIILCIFVIVIYLAIRNFMRIRYSPYYRGIQFNNIYYDMCIII